MSDAAFWTADKGWGSKDSFAHIDWTEDDYSDLADDEELKRELALDEAEDAKG